MNSKHFLSDKEKRLISGNMTKISPSENVESYYSEYAVTAFNEKNKTPENKVLEAKGFVDQNHK